MAIIGLSSRTEAIDFWRKSASLIASRTREQAIDQILAMLGQMHRADRSWLILYDKKHSHFWNMHEWVRPGIKPFLDTLQGTPIAMIGWLHAQLLQQQIVYIPDIIKLPRQARALRAEFMRQQNKSVLCVPIFSQQRLCGLFGYDTVRQHEFWSEAEQDLLREVAVLLAEMLNSTIPEQMPLLPAKTAEGRHVYIHLEHGLTAVSVDDIVAIHALRDYTRVIYSNRPPSIELRSLKSWLGALPADRFLQVQRSTIIHTGRIERLERHAKAGWQIYLLGLETPIAVGRVFRHHLRQLMGF